SKVPLQKVQKMNILDSDHKRHIAATLPNGIELHNFYVPAGGDIPDPKLNDKFDFKLKFLDFMSEHFSSNYKKEDRLIILGDINIAPLEHDVWSHKQLLKVVSHTPIEVEKLNHFKNTLNWIDSHRLFVDEAQKLYSWWSYRAKEPMQSDRGRRLDHIWTTPILKDNISKAEILKDFRSYEQPSDHAPITIELKL
ncbi:MAG: exodeoxyribonuclease III, partial [Proteobacteria bacterium]|nr:exodeoxyribonuclease III [Pseudomonadota bacterium]